MAYGYFWSAPQLVYNGRCERSRFGPDRNNNLWCIFNLQDTISWEYFIKACRYDTIWSAPIDVYSGLQASSVGGLDVVRAKNGKMWMLSSDESSPVSPPHITMYYDGSVWSDTFVILGFTDWHLASDSIGQVWALFVGSEDCHIWYDMCVDTTWTGPYIVCTYPTYDQVMSSNITVGPQGTRWAGGTAYTTSGYQIFLTYSDTNGTWTDSLIMGPRISHIPGGKLSDLISDNLGNIWIAWNDDSLGSYYAAYLDTNRNWSPYYQLTHYSSGTIAWGACKITVDRENKIWVVYDKDSNFYYRVWDGNIWSQEDSIVSSPARAVRDGDIFYDATRNRIWLSFKYGTAIADSLYVVWADPSQNISEKEKIATNLDISIFPNPVKGKLNIDFYLYKRINLRIMLYDVVGRLEKTIYSGKAGVGFFKKSIVINELPKGIYFLYIEDGNNYKVEKVVILK